MSTISIASSSVMAFESPLHNAGQTRPVPPVAELPDISTPTDVKPSQENSVKKEVAGELLAGYHHQQLVDIYVSNSGLDETGNPTTGIGLNSLQTTPTERAVAQAISQYQAQAQVEIPESKPAPL